MKKGRVIEPLWCICGSGNIEHRLPEGHLYCTDCGLHFDRPDGWKIYKIISKPVRETMFALTEQ